MPRSSTRSTRPQDNAEALLLARDSTVTRPGARDASLGAHWYDAPGARGPAPEPHDIMTGAVHNALDPAGREALIHARRVMEEAGDFRLRSGFTVPLVTLDGEAAGVSLAGERIELPPEVQHIQCLTPDNAFEL